MIRAAAIFVGCALLAGCGVRQTQVAKADKEQILLIGNGTEPQDLDPQVVTGIPEDNILRALFEGLVSEDPHDLHPIPGTAESWDISPDGKVYTFRLREAKWTNGDAVTADDFVQSYKRILSPALASEYNYMLFPVKNAEAFSKGDIKDFGKVGFRALDDRTLQVTLENPTPYFLSLLNHYSWFAVPVRSIVKFGRLDERGTRWTRPGNMVSNGPFRLKTWKTNSIIVVEKNPYYWDKDRVRLNAIKFFPIDNSSSEERAFRSGQLHVTATVPLPKIDIYKKKPEIFRNDTYLGTYFYRINVTKPFLKQKELRQALSLAIDRESIVTNITRAGEKPATCFTPPGTAGYYAKPVLRTDIPAAKALLAKAGYPDGKGLPPIEILYNNDEGHRVIAEALQEMWHKNLGVDVQLNNQEWKVYLDSQLQLAYQICRAGWIGDYVDPNSFLDMWLTGGGNNETGWSNAEYDRLIAEAGRTTDPAARLGVFGKAESILLDEMPILPIYFYTSKYLLSPSVKGWFPTILNQHPYKFVYLQE